MNFVLGLFIFALGASISIGILFWMVNHLGKEVLSLREEILSLLSLKEEDFPNQDTESSE